MSTDKPNSDPADTTPPDLAGAFRTMADINRELADPNISNDRYWELVDDLWNIDSGLGSLRKQMGKPKPDDSLGS